MSTPKQVRHYWLGARQPFLNLSDLHGRALDQVIDELMVERRHGVHQRAFGRRYMDLRRRTEARMHELFLQAGGQPERSSPHYFVLGESAWFRNLADDMHEVVLNVSELPAATTSFTYPDSFTAIGFAPEFGLPYEPKPYHGQVFRLDDLDHVVSTYGLPADIDNNTAADNTAGGYVDYENRPFEFYIEVQLWSDAPVDDCLGA